MYYTTKGTLCNITPFSG